ncbi:hypothetical protein [uncultured Polaribacter sp.]|uniref:hypothetical protein n=1 Tax=uncultured Polaribacter sp. TaxID=174711 RepID=UPI0026136990|nr:hypothetical protein [uncultured Polaribacter sp.]
MKKIHKVIALFALIFVAGIFVTIITVNTSLNKTDTKKSITKIERDTTYLLQAERKN